MLFYTSGKYSPLLITHTENCQSIRYHSTHYISFTFLTSYVNKTIYIKYDLKLLQIIRKNLYLIIHSNIFNSYGIFMYVFRHHRDTKI